MTHDRGELATAGRFGRAGRAGARVLVGAALASALVAGAPWLSGSASATTAEPSSSASADPSPSASPSTRHYGEPLDSSDPHCEISQGVYPRPVPSGSHAWLPDWVDSSAGFVCVVLDGSALLDSPNQSWMGPAAVEPLPSLDTTTLETMVTGWRQLYLFSTGLTIFLLAGLFFRVRSR